MLNSSNKWEGMIGGYSLNTWEWMITTFLLLEAELNKYMRWKV
jgi:hypothetical protein